MENIFGVLVAIAFVIISFVQNYRKEAAKASQRTPHNRPSPAPVQLPNPPAEIRQTVDRKVKIPKMEYKPELPAEVIAAQQRRKSRQESQVKIPTRLPEPETTKAFEFDLRQAVIQSAILERPYK
jgi:hypothetical protein